MITVPVETVKYLEVFGPLYIGIREYRPAGNEFLPQRLLKHRQKDIIA
jgi:hypothetical protein